MELESIACNNCGAPLEVPPGANFVSCNHCGSNLAVRRSTSVSYTENVDQIDQRTESMARQLAELRYHQELENLDRQWERERERYLVTNKHESERQETS